MCEKKSQFTGTVILKNTQQYPFNNSQQTALLEIQRDNPDYIVRTEIVSSTGEVGDIIISDKAINGFKIAFTGSATQVIIKYHLSGGLEIDNK
jgi:hypothetical protein